MRAKPNGGNSSRHRPLRELLERRRLLSSVVMPAQVPVVGALPASLDLAPVSATWQSVPSVNFSQINVSQFTDAELPLVKPLFWFSTVANSVVETTGTLPRGFINIKVWRNPQDNTPNNARVL